MVLQRTVNGKWVDFKWYSTYSAYAFHHSTPKLLTGAVNQTTGAFRIGYFVDSYKTMHFRVRSNGGSVVSPGFYMTPNQTDSC